MMTTPTSPTDATLTHTSVNGGISVNLNMTSFSYGWKNIVLVKPVQGKYDITEAEQNGFENPKFVLRGVIDSAGVSDNTLTQELLMDFAQADNTTNKTTLAIEIGKININGTNTQTGTQKLIDANATFLSTVKEGMLAHNITDNTYSGVYSVDSNGQLTLISDIFRDVNKQYEILKYVKGRPTAGYSVGGTYLNTMTVQITNFSFSLGVDSVEGRKLNYSIELVETQ